MRTNVVINDDLMQKAMSVSKHSTKRAIIEESLELLIQVKAQQDLLHYQGKLKWDGDLDQMRQGK